MTGTGSGTTVLQAIKSASSDVRVQLAESLGALLEGGSLGSSGFGVGDQGTSFGPFQIHLPAHPGVTAAEASDPTFAVQYMTPAYLSAVGQVSSSLWATDPEKAAEQAVYIAERPAADYYASRGQATVDTDYASATGALGSGVVPAGSSTSTSGVTGAVSTGGGSSETVGLVTDAGDLLTGGALGDITSLFGSAGKSAISKVFISTLDAVAQLFGANGIKDLTERAALILLGGLLLIVGLIMLVKDTGAAKTAVSVGTLAATDGASAATSVGGVATAKARQAGRARAATKRQAARDAAKKSSKPAPKS